MQASACGPSEWALCRCSSLLNCLNKPLFYFESPSLLVRREPGGTRTYDLTDWCRISYHSTISAACVHTMSFVAQLCNLISAAAFLLCPHHTDSAMLPKRAEERGKSGNIQNHQLAFFFFSFENPFNSVFMALSLPAASSSSKPSFYLTCCSSSRDTVNCSLFEEEKAFFIF